MVESRPIDLELLANAVHATRTANPAPTDVTDLAYDARRVTPGALFVCVPGLKADGHDFAPQAVAAGAAALIVERELDEPVPQLVVEDARAAMVRFWIATAILCACGFVLYYAYFSNFNNLAS